MFLTEIFPPKYIRVDLEAEDKDECFEELADHFCQVSNINAREEVLQAIRERESKMSTGIQKGIAIPHGKSTAVDDVYGVLGISRKGIDYEALDGNPVYVLFMILAPQKDSEKHLQVLQRLAELLTNPEFFTDLVAQKNSQGVFEILKKYEDLLNALN
jgi:PTS system fructose-specific IIC component/PTS system nitrogen regulatory IIA component